MAPPTARDIAVIIPAFNAADTIERCVRCVVDQTNAVAEIVVVDNASTDDTTRRATNAGARVASELVRGRSRARNRGVAETSGRILCFIDADCEVPPDWVERSLALLHEPWLGAVQSRVQKSLEAPPGRRFTQAHYYWPFLDTCALMVTRAAWKAAGGFDEELPRNEDMDFSFRLLASGFAFGWQPDTIVRKLHNLTPSQALRRGWVGGQSLGLAAAKWRHELEVSQSRFTLDLGKGVIKAALREMKRPRSSRGTFVLEASARMAGALQGLTSLCEPTRRRSVTDLPRRLGAQRFLVLGPDDALLYDARAQGLSLLDAAQSAALVRYLDDREPNRADIDRLQRTLGLPPQ